MPSFRIKDANSEQRSFQQRMIWAAVLILVSAGILGTRLSLLQVVRHDYYLENYTGFVHLACILILLRAFVR